MQPDQLSDAQLDDLAAHIAPRLPTGTHGDRVILGRRQFAAAMGGTIGAGALMALGVDRATAQAAGNFGTEEEPGNMWAYNLDVANGVTSNLPMGGNDIEDVGSLSIEKASIDELLENLYFGNLSQDPDNPDGLAFNEKGTGTGSRPMSGVLTSSLVGVAGDNSSNELINLNQGDLRVSSGEIIVIINNQNDNDVRVDKLSHALFTEKTVRWTETRGSPGPTSYSGSTTLEIAIDDAGVTYDVIAIATGGAL